MKFTRRLILGTGAILLPLVTVVGTGIAPAGAQGGQVNEAGTIICNYITGTVKFIPALRSPGTPVPTTATFTLKVSKCKNLVGATVIPVKGGNAHAAVTMKTDSCASFFGATSGSITFSFRWKQSPPISPSFSVYTGYNFFFPPPTDRFIFPNAGGAGSTTGSYLETSGSTMNLNGNQSESVIDGRCAANTGLSVLTIVGTSTSL